MQVRKPRLPGCGALVLAVLSIAPLAAAAADRDRPRVGLVLGGGGARGAAHIGVLEELERQRIPIDAIAGTSMGAIVGGLYAAGMSATELEDLFAALDWADALADEPARRQLSFRRKQDDARFPIHFELGVRDGKLLLPMGAVQGQKLDLILRELTIGVSHIHDFDDLPIPFRAIASDIERGEPWVMGEGDLARSIRASMSVPGVFAPVRIGDRLLVDGGIVGNLPIDVIREMDVDVVIAVDVEFPLYRGEDLDSVLTISEQILTILIRKDTLRQIATLDDDDILIRPALGTFPSSNFGEITDAIEPGVRAAEAVADKLHGLSVDAATYAAYEARRTRRPAADDALAFVRVAQDGRIRPAILESRLETRPGDRVDPDCLSEDAERLYGLGLYEQVGYRLVEENGRTGVEFQARAKSWGPDTLQFSLALEDDVQGSTSFNVSTRLTRAALNPHGGEWRTDLQVGTEPQLASELYQPFGSASTLFVAPHIALWQSNFDTFDSGDEIARLRLSETEGGVDLGAEVGDVAEFRFGAYRGFGSARVRIGDPAIPDADFDTGGIFARFRIDTLDNARFPRHGVWADLRWGRSLRGLGADDRFDTIQTELLGAWSRGKNSWSAGLSYQTTAEGVSRVQDHFPLGGFLRLSGLENGEIRGPHAALGRVVFHRRVGESAGGLLDVPVYVGTSLEAGNAWPSRADIDLGSLNVGGSVFVGLDSYLGPIYLAAGFTEGGRRNYYLFIGSPPR